MYISSLITYILKLHSSNCLYINLKHLTCCIIRVRQWWAALFSCRSRGSGVPVARRLNGLEPEVPTLRWKREGARHTAKLLACIWKKEVEGKRLKTFSYHIDMKFTLLNFQSIVSIPAAFMKIFKYSSMTHLPDSDGNLLPHQQGMWEAPLRLLGFHLAA